MTKCQSQNRSQKKRKVRAGAVPELVKGWSRSHNQLVPALTGAGLSAPDSNKNSIKNMLRNGFLGLFLNAKTLNYLFIGAYQNIQKEAEPETFLKNP